MCLKKLACGLLVTALSFSPLLASPSQSPSTSVVLSPAEADAIQAALTQAREALDKSNKEITAQSKRLTTLSVFCGVLAGAVAIDLSERAVESAVRYFKK